MSKQTMTRREALVWLGKLGGSAALMQGAALFGLARQAQANESSQPTSLLPVGTSKPKVLILGAGISGLVSAYELTKAGYQCQILEASHRAGGRNFTFRHGDFIDELGNPQHCGFDAESHLYFNAGAARIPAHHTAILHYCRELGVEMQLFTNHNKNCYAQDPAVFDGKPIRIREYEADVRGFYAELMAKSIQGKHQLDQPFDDIAIEQLLQFTQTFGDLSSDLTYQGSERAGYSSGGILSHGKLKKPRALADMLRSNFVQGAMHFSEIADQASALMTPVGGMDHIVKGLLKQVGSLVQLQSQVKNIQLMANGVEVSYLHKGELKTTRADYCLNCIPSHLLAGMENNFPTPYVDAMKQLRRGKLSKIALQAKQRFWEKDQIYSGISWTNQDITQIWYPPHGAFRQKGILLGAYTWDPEISDRIAVLSNKQRVAMAVQQGKAVHADYDQHIETGNSICWQRMNHMLGCGAVWSDELLASSFSTLQQPVGRHYLVGDQVSFHPGWQEGAVRSAWFALEHIQTMERQKQGAV